jgi:zinc transport system ATP-binding protein
MKELIGIRNLSFKYGDNPVLENVSFEIIQNDFILIIGPNGGGKTTLVKLILGILKPMVGEVHFHGDIASRLGYVPQFSGFNRSFPISTFDMVLTGCINGGNYLKKFSKDDVERTNGILEKLSLYKKRHENINNLSGGQVQKALVARALVSEPVALFLDEPTASIDITSKTTLLDLLEEINKNMCIVVVTHDPTPFAHTYRHIACLNRILYYHKRGELDIHTLEQVYGCPVELLGHGIPHTFLKEH